MRKTQNSGLTSEIEWAWCAALGYWWRTFARSPWVIKALPVRQLYYTRIHLPAWTNEANNLAYINMHVDLHIALLHVYKRQKNSPSNSSPSPNYQRPASELHSPSNIREQSCSPIPSLASCSLVPCMTSAENMGRVFLSTARK